MFLYAIFYMYSHLPTSSLVPFVVYTGYSLIGSTGLSLWMNVFVGVDNWYGYGVRGVRGV